MAKIKRAELDLLVLKGVWESAVAQVFYPF